MSCSGSTLFTANPFQSVVQEDVGLETLRFLASRAEYGSANTDHDIAGAAARQRFLAQRSCPQEQRQASAGSSGPRAGHVDFSWEALLQFGDMILTVHGPSGKSEPTRAETKRKRPNYDNRLRAAAATSSRCPACTHLCEMVCSMCFFVYLLSSHVVILVSNVPEACAAWGQLASGERFAFFNMPLRCWQLLPAVRLCQ